MSHIFISYSKDDVAFARHLRRLLEAEGFSVWMDETRLVPAERWWPTIEANIRSCAAFMVIMSAHSKQSVWVEREILVAEEEEDVKKPIFPILLAGKRWARLAEKQYEDMTGGLNATLSPRLIGGLARYAPRTREPAPPPLPGPLLETGQQLIDEPVTTSQTRRRVPALVWVVALVAVIGLVGLFAMNGGFGGGDGGTPTSPATATEQTVGQALTGAPSPTPTDAPVQSETPTLTPTDTPVPPTDTPEPPSLTNSPTATQTPTSMATDTPVPPTETNTPTPSATLSQTEEAATVNAFVHEFQTGEAAALTATAAGWTPTPTPDYRLTAAAQIASEQTATADAWTDTLTPTWTLTPTPSPIPDPLQVTLETARTFTGNNGDWMPFEWDFDGVPMVLVPVGCFDMGSDDGDSDEQPVHWQCLDEPFWIDKYEVTNEQFAHFGGNARRESVWAGDNRPRGRVTWFEARDFCALRGARLPTEREWEYAARGPDSLIYPWGNAWVEDMVVWSGNSDRQLSDVGSYPFGVSWVGALDMSGNVWEWVNSLYVPYPYDSTDSRERDTGDSTEFLRVLRGGSWDSYGTSFLRVPNRDGDYPHNSNANGGFRCARDFRDEDLRVG